jgi:tetratricopeptide (TPR) repeat protein
LYKEEGKIEEAKQYYKLAADQGRAAAQYNLGLLYRQEGKIEEAKQYYKLAADQGHVEAQNNLANFLEDDM